MKVTTTSLKQGKFETRFWHKIFEEEVGRVKGHFGPVNTSVTLHFDAPLPSTAADRTLANIRTVSPYHPPARVTLLAEKMVSSGFIISMKRTSRGNLTETGRSRISCPGMKPLNFLPSHSHGWEWRVESGNPIFE
jgi:hypothetical protein